jgi:hypothetical protein
VVPTGGVEPTPPGGGVVTGGPDGAGVGGALSTGGGCSGWVRTRMQELLKEHSTATKARRNHAGIDQNLIQNLVSGELFLLDAGP